MYSELKSDFHIIEARIKKKARIIVLSDLRITLKYSNSGFVITNQTLFIINLNYEEYNIE